MKNRESFYSCAEIEEDIEKIKQNYKTDKENYSDESLTKFLAE